MHQLKQSSKFMFACFSVKIKKLTTSLTSFFNCYLAAALGHYQGDSLTYPMLIAALFNSSPEVTRNLHVLLHLNLLVLYFLLPRIFSKC